MADGTDIEEIYPDKYGVVRQVLVRTSNVKLRRDTRKLYLLEGACCDIVEII